MIGAVANPSEARAVSCPICGAERFWTVSFFDPDTGSIVLRTHGYYWRLCRNCGNAAPSIRVSSSELQAYWERNRLDGSVRPVTENLWKQRMRESEVWGRRTYDFVRPWIKDCRGRFLDIGSGLGGTVAKFAAEGWKAFGLDPDPNTKPFNDRLGINVQIARFEEAELHPTYDLVCVAHAIYFLEDPKESLLRIRGLLAEDGFCVVVYSHLFSSMNVGRPALPHTWYPTRDSCVYLFGQEGFDLVAKKSLRGSDMLLFRLASAARQASGRPWHALALHKSQTLRYRTIGTVLNATRSVYRKFRRG